MEKTRIQICIGSSCFSRGNARNVDILEKYLAENHLVDDVDVATSGSLCLGRCADGPIVVINDNVFTNVDAGVMRDLLRRYLPSKKQS